jgi:hypothetical protein
MTYTNIAVLAARYGEAGRGLTTSEMKVFSQNGEDGVLAEIFRRIGTTSCFFVEFGIGTAIEGNSVFLADILGWRGVFVEGDQRDYAGLARKYAGTDRVATVQAYLTPENIAATFAAAQVPPEFDLLSIDIDGNDYWIWDALLPPYAPRVVVIEYNGSIPPASRIVHNYDPESSFPVDDAYGASLGAMRSLGKKKGYFFVHSELSGNNAFFVRDDLARHFADISPVADRVANFRLLGYTFPHHDGDSDPSEVEE